MCDPCVTHVWPMCDPCVAHVWPIMWVGSMLVCQLSLPPHMCTCAVLRCDVLSRCPLCVLHQATSFARPTHGGDSCKHTGTQQTGRHRQTDRQAHVHTHTDTGRDMRAFALALRHLDTQTHPPTVTVSPCVNSSVGWKRPFTRMPGFSKQSGAMVATDTLNSYVALPGLTELGRSTGGLPAQAAARRRTTPGRSASIVVGVQCRMWPHSLQVTQRSNRSCPCIALC